MIVLDTDVLIEILDKRSEKGQKALDRLRESGESASISITVITLHEILYGLEKYARPVNDVMQLPVLPYTKKDAGLSAKIELEAERKGAPVRRADAMIASVAIGSGSSLYTFDSHFTSIKSLNLGLRLFS